MADGKTSILTTKCLETNALSTKKGIREKNLALSGFETMFDVHLDLSDEAYENDSNSLA